MIALRCQKNRTWDVRGSLGRFRPFPRLCDRIPLCSQRKLFLTGPGDPNRAFEQSRIALPVVDFVVGDFERSENGPCWRGCDGYLGRGPHGLGEISPRPPPRIKIAGKSPTRRKETRFPYRRVPPGAALTPSRGSGSRDRPLVES